MLDNAHTGSEDGKEEAHILFDFGGMKYSELLREFRTVENHLNSDVRSVLAGSAFTSKPQTAKVAFKTANCLGLSEQDSIARFIESATSAGLKLLPADLVASMCLAHPFHGKEVHALMMPARDTNGELARLKIVDGELQTYAMTNLSPCGNRTFALRVQ